MPTRTLSKSDCLLQIEGITEPQVLRYFETLNAGDFQATAALFAEDGILEAPFEDHLHGQEAIATYLQAEAQGMQLKPQEGISQTLENGQQQVQVMGKVRTPLFWVNVAWQLILNPNGEIAVVTVKLLASLQELFNLQNKSDH
ncbi:nuclear transport factor 2 family protein [Lyngbya sp. PCC 8106]|uniref:nuclear transport factor 2 family protein n=1 Tax=Lyngbya sp. (strain PCC 8106) TaxID=313612 RepID=UPI0000EACF0D|nr:nuclear transport factor 2 family protein [Lyngbya sp. PCC 8106]EAW33868.1 Nuclear transport factor 2 [Lyngbya sp. PCC 8106]